MSLLEISELSIDFGTARGALHAVRNVSLEIEPGRIIGLVGESGCGKSTLANAILRLLSPNAKVQSGEIRFQGRDLLRLSERAMRDVRGQRISMIFQDPMTALNPVRTIGSQMSAIQYREKRSGADRRRRAMQMMERVGIADVESRLHAYPHEFSGGMRQRICIAMALLTEPALLIADEPTTALDATLEVQIIHLLQELQREIGCAILFVSHHLGVIAELCEDVVVMYAGEVIERGPVRGIFHDAGHPYTQALLACDPGRIKERTRNLPTIPGEIPDLVRPPSGCIFRTRCPEAFGRCAREDPPPYRMRGPHEARCHLLDQP